MEIIPHRHFGMPGDIQKHTLVYTVVVAAFLAAFFDLSRIASLGAIFYLVMDIAVHWGVLRHLRRQVGASAAVLVTAIILDGVVLAAFVAIKGQADPTIVVVALAGIALIVAGERLFLRNRERAPAAQ
jgi:hypothetical protein